jgi:hypothetical protein
MLDSNSVRIAQFDTVVVDYETNMGTAKQIKGEAHSVFSDWMIIRDKNNQFRAIDLEHVKSVKRKWAKLGWTNFVVRIEGDS